MLVNSETFPFDSVVMMNRCFSRVSPVTAVRPRVEPVPCPVEIVDVFVADRRDSSRRAAGRRGSCGAGRRSSSTEARLVRTRSIAGRYPLRQLSAKVGQSCWKPWLSPNFSSSAMMLERQSTTVPNMSNANALVGKRHGSSTTLPSTPPSARLCNASAPFDSGNRTGGGGRSPAFDQLATPNPNSDCAPGVRLTNSP